MNKNVKVLTKIMGKDDKHYPLLHSVIQNDMRGFIYLNNNSTKALIINKLNWVYVIGNKIDLNFDQEMIEILTKRESDNYIWFGMSKHWEKEIRKISGIDIKSYPRLQWKFNTKLFKRIEIKQNSFSYRKINKTNINKIYSGINNSIIDFWTSKGNFLKKGYGYYVEENNEIIGLIISAGIYNNEAEIDIFVNNRYQKQGIGKLLSIKFIQTCLENNIIPKWDCYKYNEGSVKLAKSLGFEIVNEYPCNLIIRSKKHGIT